VGTLALIDYATTRNILRVGPTMKLTIESTVSSLKLDSTTIYPIAIVGDDENIAHILDILL